MRKLDPNKLSVESIKKISIFYDDKDDVAIKLALEDAMSFIFLGGTFESRIKQGKRFHLIDEKLYKKLWNMAYAYNLERYPTVMESNEKKNGYGNKHKSFLLDVE